METERLYTIPVSALQPLTIEELSSRLNNEKVICSPDELYQRDFRGLADCMGLESLWAPDNDHVRRLIKIWSSKSLEKANLGKFCDFLERIDRFDVLEDIRNWLDEDARMYLNRDSQLAIWRPTTESESSDDNFDPPSYSHIFDACVLHVDADNDFGQMIIRNMTAMHLRVCDKNQNLQPGENKLRALNRLIEHECRTLVVIFSNDLIHDKNCMNLFYFAWNQSNNANAILKRVIPCVYKDCILPQDILSLVRLDFNRYEPREFLLKLRHSIARATDVSSYNIPSLPNASSLHNRQSEALREIESVTIEEVELAPLPELSDSDSNDLNCAPPEPVPLSKRIRCAIARLAPRRKRRHARPAASDTA